MEVIIEIKKDQSEDIKLYVKTKKHMCCGTMCKICIDAHDEVEKAIIEISKWPRFQQKEQKK